MSRFSIVSRGEPVAWARAGKHGKFSFTPAKQKEAMRTLQYAASQAMGSQKPLEGPLHVDMLFAYPWPKAISKRAREAPDGFWRQSRPDIDNLVKLVCDALNAIVWGDDAQIVCLNVKKIYDDIPRVELIVA